MSTPENDDTVQTSEADTLRAEVARLTSRLADRVDEATRLGNKFEEVQNQYNNCLELSENMMKEFAQTIAERDALRAEVARLVAENGELRRALSDTLTALDKGLGVTPDCAVEFLCQAPGEVRAGLERCRERIDRTVIEARTAEGALRVAGEQLAAIHAALGNGGDEALWAPGKTAGEAVQALAEERDVLREQNARTESHLRGELETAHNEIAALKHGPAVRLEWSPWQQASGIRETYLRLRFGYIEASIGQIVYQHGIYEASLHHSDRDGGTTTTITGTSLADVGTVYVAAMQSAGLPVVSIPTLPESA